MTAATGQAVRISAPTIIAVLLCAFIAAAVPATARAERTGATVPRIKTGFLYNFTLYVDWPADVFPGHDTPLSVCVTGTNSLGDALDGIRGKSSRARQLQVRFVDRPEEFDHCQLLFIGASEKVRLPKILAATRRKSILTVSDLEGFIAAGGIIGLTMIDNTVRFEINYQAAQQSRLKISSQLLKLAHDVMY